MTDFARAVTFSPGAKVKADEHNDNWDALELFLNSTGTPKVQALSALPSATPGQIIVCNASGVPQYRTAGGAATVDSSGNLALNHAFNVQGADVGLSQDGLSWVTLCTVGVPAGTYLVVGSCEVFATAASFNKGSARLAGDALGQISRGDHQVAAGSLSAVSIGLVGAITTGASDTLRLQAVTTAAGGSHFGGSGRLFAVRVA